ncbi:class I SAM-dependent methyltransferase [Paraburkholderia sp. J11-2]|uniref:class I SAM-dependent methyltransferase n=1 Tax=Paraburkholderia sp. J11-2 TaxID=2805431 RepID=UPI002AB766BD|nr:class I SAM-dependent methyltransferase [Paraburkholderia sp. J11-2]
MENVQVGRRDKLIGELEIKELLGAEIGALCRPVVSRTDGQVLYIDHTDTESLKAKYAGDRDVDVEAIVDVDAVWGENTLSDALGSRSVDYVVASHVIEHVPDLVTWLSELRSVLKSGGQVRLAVPDKRFTFDHLRRDSNLADILTAYVARARRPQIQQILDYRLNVSPIPCDEAWRTPLGSRPAKRQHTFNQALEIARYYAGNEEYHDVHCWVFTPKSFAQLFAALADGGLIDFACERFFDTAFHELEFIVWIKPADRQTAVESWKRMAETAAEFMPQLQKSPTPVSEPEADNITLVPEQDVMALKDRISAMEASHSWRVTAPLRKIRSRFMRQ